MRKRRRSDPVLWQNPLYQQKIRKPKDNTQTPPKTSTTQRLRTDLGRSVGVTSHPTVCMELFSETAVGCTASYFVKIIWCSCWFWPPPPLFWGWILLMERELLSCDNLLPIRLLYNMQINMFKLILLILRSQKGGCCSISDDLSCSFKWTKVKVFVFIMLCKLNYG